MSVSGIDKSLSGTSGWIHGAGQRGKKDSGPDYDQLAKKILEERDQDGDGLLSASELRMSRKRFAAVDTDSDGFVSQEELATHVSSGNSNSHLHKIAAAIIAQQDTDGDGKLSKSESELANEQFEQADSDGDGFLTQSEIANALGASRKEFNEAMQEGMASMRGEQQDRGAGNDDRKGTYPLGSPDSDATSKSGYNERKDLNGDGVVSPEEVAAILEHGLAKAKSMVASGELDIKTEDNGGSTVDGTEENAAVIAGEKQDEGHGGRHGVPVWLRRRAMEAYEGQMGTLLSRVLGGTGTPVAADGVEGASPVTEAAEGTVADQVPAADATAAVPETGEMLSALV
ncbi:hypothetical protein N1030_17420 [Desulfovibrio mangrovi]|uniref:hypothetical protein n=1 Tax=Desulfovibrio mangrovi TaxID=2976983 RepID=UPI00224568DC|nr:hypothetical protein [Desulfovibrio mangrovi]UZP67353.1 hypothetical protein N1030_17420 [Desulfovibrio mangrovi]